ncbi:F-box domain-containing protein [Caenorhabditis elegans]|uniref:F-box domain-containing protein n=1 Tax=Caenorhabditis elegans TaxID=6239 RepID=P91233_CAEEL|nr:F-box domain-containing protein [Caenorhabditis elegans]CCD69008.1 F-box domain-containing protein [Caenorhabditis elegans]|eukprot:NP_494359.1 SKN-1 Dependent Zygotic transcript [Caenorhabditis elegans]
MATRFPLLLFCLPEKNLRIVLEQMRFLDLLAFSLCSKITKAHTTQLKRNIKYIALDASSGVSIRLQLPDREQINLDVKTDRFDRCNLNFWEIANVTYRQPTRGYQQARYEQEFCWKKNGFGLRDWIDHTMEIFNLPVIDQFYLSGTVLSLADTRQIGEALNGLKVTSMDFWCYTEDRVYNIRRNLETVGLIFAHPDSEHFSKLSTQKILSENQTSVLHRSPDFALMAEMRYFVDEASYACITLNDLLVSNCTKLIITDSTLKSEELNIFLKHWINGSIQTCEFLKLETSVRTQWNMETVLKGVAHKTASKVKDGAPGARDMFIIPRIDLPNLSLTYIPYDGRYSVLTIDARCG